MDKKGAGLRPWILSLVLVILGSFCFVAFAFNFIYQTNPTSDIFDSKYHINSSVVSMQQNLDDFASTTNNVKEILYTFNFILLYLIY